MTPTAPMAPMASTPVTSTGVTDAVRGDLHLRDLSLGAHGVDGSPMTPTASTPVTSIDVNGVDGVNRLVSSTELKLLTASMEALDAVGA